MREKQQEAEYLEVPTSSEVLEGHHNQWHHHQGPKQDLSQTVHFQVKQTHLPGATEGNIMSQMNVNRNGLCMLNM